MQTTYGKVTYNSKRMKRWQAFDLAINTLVQIFASHTIVPGGSSHLIPTDPGQQQ